MQATGISGPFPVTTIRSASPFHYTHLNPQAYRRQPRTQSFEERAQCLFVAIITTSGMREFVFYTRDPEQVRKRFEEVRTGITSHQIQLMIQPDEGWSVYAQLG